MRFNAFEAPLKPQSTKIQLNAISFSLSITANINIFAAKLFLLN